MGSGFSSFLLAVGAIVTEAAPSPR